MAAQNFDSSHIRGGGIRDELKLTFKSGVLARRVDMDTRSDLREKR